MDDNTVTFLQLLLELGLVPVDGSSACRYGTCPIFRFVSDNLVFDYDVLLLLGLPLLCLSGLLRGDGWPSTAVVLEFKLAYFETTHDGVYKSFRTIYNIFLK